MKIIAFRDAANRSVGRAVAITGPSSRTAAHDPRWPAVAAALRALRDSKRYAVRIVDANCGAGCLLLHAMRHARALGFTAIEGRGIGGSPALIGRARAAATRLDEPAIGVIFDMADMVEALRDEHDLPADIVLWSGGTGDPGHPVSDALRRAGDQVISDASAGMAHKEAA